VVEVAEIEHLQVDTFGAGVVPPANGVGHFGWSAGVRYAGYRRGQKADLKQAMRFHRGAWILIPSDRC
jgi:hypothetical protein